MLQKIKPMERTNLNDPLYTEFTQVHAAKLYCSLRCCKWENFLILNIHQHVYQNVACILVNIITLRLYTARVRGRFFNAV